MTSSPRVAGSVGIGLLVCVAVAGCNGSTANDSGNNDTGTGTDATAADGTGTDVGGMADMNRFRDVGGNINTDSAQTNCTVYVMPQTGTPTSTFTATGNNWYDATTNQPAMGAYTHVVLTLPDGTNVMETFQMNAGSFSATLPAPNGGSTFPVGTYTLTVGEFVPCQFTTMFSVH